MLTFKHPLPLGIFNNLPSGGYGFYLERTAHLGWGGEWGLGLYGFKKKKGGRGSSHLHSLVWLHYDLEPIDLMCFEEWNN